MLWTMLVLVGILWRLSFVSDYATSRIKKVVFCRHFLAGILALVCWVPYSAMAAQDHETTVAAAPARTIPLAVGQPAKSQGRADVAGLCRWSGTIEPWPTSTWPTESHRE